MQLDKTTKIVITVIELILFVLCLLAIVDDFLFFTTKEKATARVINIENNQKRGSSIIELEYYNDFNKIRILTSVKVDGEYRKQVIKNPPGSIAIYYRKFFPKEIYIVNYEYPGWGIYLCF
ncbi:MAG: hypothetical protein M0D57_00470 [Sphingobacteriales bacterium JAD_PAG50586_3]|nr:MAG: hypothetical protein M0D57_00470 [Sphingobacteriales bacterium JAD_PAG50586_3]